MFELLFRWWFLVTNLHFIFGILRVKSQNYPVLLKMIRKDDKIILEILKVEYLKFLNKSIFFLNQKRILNYGDPKLSTNICTYMKSFLKYFSLFFTTDRYFKFSILFSIFNFYLCYIW